ncbi:stress-induced hydrophobic peptide [Heterobasidion irregulare TC 32-1]|uniref:Stress-induced hydrophobic peptide n=1 Tax=Heterobasidion irregulare (strain TC 32-1) TaxID=747525 RepID=W4KJ93_HETIT|nr:stress-induced hydrophobic peptide [Heterobasidion irregulare TC 32-1]ETW85917.1 stress-induced hydrophobic peptide [Heterobasidion irregulare TC 32-1]
MTRADLKPKRHHGYAVVLFILGTLFPPLAVAARFGIGSDFWLNLLLTICGYIPGHGHNFYIQNIRNNKNNRRTPKWAQRYGLVDTTKIKRDAKRSQWAGRYAERLPRSTLEGQSYEDGQEPGSSSIDLSTENRGGRSTAPNGNGHGGELWNPEEEQYYGQRNSDAASTTSGRWHYPANFEDTLPQSGGTLKKKKKQDRWARTEDAYANGGEVAPKKKKKKRSTRSKAGDLDGDSFSRRSGSTTNFPEDPEGGLYGERRAENGGTAEPTRTDDDALFTHQF